MEIFDCCCETPVSPCPSVSSAALFLFVWLFLKKGDGWRTIVILHFLTFLESSAHISFFPLSYFSLLVLISFFLPSLLLLNVWVRRVRCFIKVTIFLTTYVSLVFRGVLYIVKKAVYLTKDRQTPCDKKVSPCIFCDVRNRS
ncbi:hypothetical protein V8F33_000589 [Rhypophila sp. PSN 637]